MLATIPILFGWLFTIASCYAAGALVLEKLRLNLFREEHRFLRFIAGSACVSLGVFALTAMHLAFEASFLAAGVLLIALAVLRRGKQPAATRLPDFPVFWKIVFLTPFLIFGVYYFVHALAPEMSPDGATYHLGIVGRYLRQHSFGSITTDMYANLSEGIEMLFLPAYSIGRHSSAALVEFTFLLMLPWGMLCYARRIGHARAGVFAALLVYTSPVFGMSGTIAYNDAAGTAILFALFYSLQIWSETRQEQLIPVTGLIAGYCYGSKYTLFLALPFAGLFLLWKLVRGHQPFLRRLLVYSGFALLTVVPWMAKNAIIVHNPFSPFANRLFPNRFVTIHFEQEYGDLMRNRDGITLAKRPFDHIVSGEKTAGILGPVYFFAPLALLALRLRAGRQLLLAALVFLLPAYTNVETRFLMPMSPFLLLALGLAAANISFGVPIILTFALVTAWPPNVRYYCSLNAWRLTDFHPREAFRLVPESATLRKRMPEYRIAELLETATAPGSRIFTYSNPPEAYTSREIIVKYESALGNLLGEMLWTPLIPDYQPTQSLRFSFDPRNLRAVRVVQTASHPSDLWTVSEFRLFDGPKEIPRLSSWKLRASRNKWDAPLAFDNNPVTRWSTQEPMRPGMFLAVYFDAPRPVSAILLQCAVQWAPNLRLEGSSDGLNWDLLTDQPSREQQIVNIDMRPAAMLELKARGITHLLITSEDFGTDDFYQRQKDWNLEFAGEAQGSRLYKLL